MTGQRATFQATSNDPPQAHQVGDPAAELRAEGQQDERGDHKDGEPDGEPDGGQPHFPEGAALLDVVGAVEAVDDRGEGAGRGPQRRQDAEGEEPAPLPRDQLADVVLDEVERLAGEHLAEHVHEAVQEVGDGR